MSIDFTRELFPNMSGGIINKSIWHAKKGEELPMVLPPEGIDTVTFCTSGVFEYKDSLGESKHITTVGERHTHPENAVSGELTISCLESGDHFCFSMHDDGKALSGRVVKLVVNSNVSVPPGYALFCIDSYGFSGKKKVDVVLPVMDAYQNFSPKKPGYAALIKTISNEEIQAEFNNGL